MNTFKQNNPTNLIGSQEDINSLGEKEKARILVVSDSHGNYASLKSVVQEFGGECDAMIFCGDGIEDVARLVEIADSVPPVLGIVEGNNDPDTYPVNGEEVHVPLSCSLKVAGHNVFFTHGHRFSLYEGLDGMKKTASTIGCDAIFFGHTHVSFNALVSGNIFVLNPGSCSRPRQCQPPSFAVVEIEKEKEHYEAVFYQVIPGERKAFVPETFFS
ncbi:YfcE family phosphodiesterase [Treponema sp.]|uniref:YfcE family phosphodiesterase n=1 Tax=Treponema sp. TaxID=166 RepID=UPI00298D9F9D|nr:YfcE family phosphodiesterase [Treponema sp.]MCQ2240858.1 YfcE family phosphodiesterase [Treponema sp.]